MSEVANIHVLSGFGGKQPAAILVNVAGVSILLDAGGDIEDGREVDWVVPEDLDAILLTHNHFDHIGNVNNLPKTVPIYCSDITAQSLPQELMIKVIPIRGTFMIGDVTVTTGASGHAYGGVWFHLDCAGGIFYSGDISLESWLYHFDPPPKADFALLDASYGLYNCAQQTVREVILQQLDQPTLLPVPPSGRAVELALWLSEQGIHPALDDECFMYLSQMIEFNDGSLKDEIPNKLKAIADQISPVTLEHPILLAGSADGYEGMAAHLKAQPDFQHQVVFTGHCNAQARKDCQKGLAKFFRWNVHPTLDCLKHVAELLECKTLMPLFTEIEDSTAWDRAFEGIGLELNTQIIVR